MLSSHQAIVKVLWSILRAGGKLLLGFGAFAPLPTPFPSFFWWKKQKGGWPGQFCLVCYCPNLEKKDRLYGFQPKQPDFVWGGEDARACVLVQLFFLGTHVKNPFATAENAGTIVSSAAAPGGVAQGLGAWKVHIKYQLGSLLNFL